jgi:hypothetical protein
MPITVSQISLVYSGGSANSDPTLSLGGNSSVIPITNNQIDNIFDNVAPTDTQTGLTDYRCMYIFNDGDETVYNCQVWIASAVSGGSVISLGIAQQNEVQRITITGAVTGGSMTLSFGGIQFTSVFDHSITVWGNNIALQMNGLLGTDNQPILSGITVIGQTSNSISYFDVTFSGLDGGRDQEMLTVIGNNFTPQQPISVTLLAQGSPVNTIAPSISVKTTPPTGVAFGSPTPTNSITVSRLDSGDGFPIWAQRVTPAGAASLSQDGFIMNVQIESLPPLI